MKKDNILYKVPALSLAAAMLAGMGKRQHYRKEILYRDCRQMIKT